uniref:Uncharacterized protein n=1 Tax=Lepeophtheirus salmonis TaxID=72036 RepID=A0A0K2UJN1_LEPSM
MSSHLMELSFILKMSFNMQTGYFIIHWSKYASVALYLVWNCCILNTSIITEDIFHKDE